MAKHIFLPDGFRDVQGYTPPKRTIFWKAPDRDRHSHGYRLESRLKRTWDAIDQQGQERRAIGLPHPDGAHITFRLRKGSEQQLRKLETLKGGRGLDKVRLRHVFTDTVDGEEFTIAVVWVPKDKRGFYAKKLQEYLQQETEKGNPKHNDLIACIEDIRSTLLDDYWPKHEQGRMPGEQPDWVEVWLAAERTDDLNDGAQGRFATVCQTLGIEWAARQVIFPERRVLLVKANRSQLQDLIESSDDVAELRLARECVSFFLRDAEVHGWIDDLTTRLVLPGATSPAVCVLDTGVNRGHRLLEPVCLESDCLTVMSGWGVHDHHRQGHGTGMCGLAAYGPLEVPLASRGSVVLTHWVESVKVQGPDGHADTLPKDLWGQFTQRAAYEIEIVQPDRSRIFCMAITSNEDMDRGMPSSWSGAVDQLTSGYLDGNRRLMLISAGNVDGDEEWLAYPDSNVTAGIQDPGQVWNALTVGAFTDKVDFRDEDGSWAGFVPLAQKGDLSPYSTTSLVDWNKTWPIKPEIVCEGGNLLKTPDGHISNHDDLDSLTTSSRDTSKPLTTMWGTSGATAHAAWMAGQIQAAYPQAWPETVRALLVHSARWTDAMLACRRPTTTKDGYRQLLATVGYGVPDLHRALASAKSSLTLVAQQHIQPFAKKPGGGDKTNAMHVYRLPWPTETLLELPPQTRVTVRITLSYFVEPSPQEIGWKDRYRYPSFGLRWDMMRPIEDRSVFLRRITAAIAQDEQGDERDDEADPQSGQDTRWTVGFNTRSRGSLHADIWMNATAAEVATCDLIAVYPTIGWWRKRKHLGKLETQARYSLLISIETADQSVDIYTPVAEKVGVPISLDVLT